MATILSDLQTRFNTWLRDTQDLTFTQAEKLELLTEAINDPFVAKITRDTSLTTTASTYSYAVPSSITSITELGIDLDGTGVALPIDRGEYDLIDGTIRLRDLLPTSKTLIVTGKQKLTTAATDFPQPLPEYILHMAMVAAFEMLKTSLTTRFVKNDITMSEIMNSISSHRQRAAEIRRELTNQRLVSI